MSNFTLHISRSLLRQTVAIVLMSVMIVLQAPFPVRAAVLRAPDEQVSDLGNRVSTWLSSVANKTTTTNRERKGVRPASPQTKAEREAQVAAIELNVSGEIELMSRQPMLLMAIPVDQNGTAVHGLKVKWDSSNKRVVFVRKTGQVMAGLPGDATLTASVGGKQATVKVKVVEGTKEPFGGKKRVDSTRRPQSEAIRTRANTNTLVAQKMTSRQKRAHAIANLTGRMGLVPFIRPPNDDPLPDNETSSLYQANNQIGSPPGKTKPGAMTAASSVPVVESGTKNFGFDLPVVSLPGRRLDLAMALSYNSLLWNKSTNPSNGSTWMTYDVDTGYPAPGFRLGFGQIEDQGSAGFTLTDSNGTRHALIFSSTSNYVSKDGTNLLYVGGSGWGTLFYPDGTQVSYGAAGGGYRNYPTMITDANGNFMLISYVNGVGPRIDTIQDTVGRYVRFYYDSNSDLVAITSPGLTGQSDLQVMRFYYETLTLPSGLFASGINVDKPATARVVRHVYLPASAEGSSSSSGDIGYRFDYSQYGMISQIVKFHGMTASTTSLSTTGTVTEGTNTVAATTSYDYFASASSLSDVPTFAHRTDEWAGRTSGGSAPQYAFALSEESTETTTTITAPNGTVMVSVTIKNTGAWNDGLIKEVRLQNSTPVVFKKINYTWEQNATTGVPRLADIRFMNDANKTTARVFTYDDANTTFNNVSVESEREFTSDGSLGTELRRITTSYVTSSSYLNRRLLSLPSTVTVFPGGSSTPASRIDYAYDNYGSSHENLTSRDDIIMHSLAFDPFQDVEEVWDWVCTEWGYNETGFFTCLNWEWQFIGFYTAYDPSTDYRGNVTSTTTYPDANSTSNTITHANTFDIAGNVMTAQVDCCQSQSFTYSSANYDYAYPVSTMKGNPSGLNLTSSMTFDMNTGLVASATDENGRVTYFAYNTDSLRLDHIDFPDGGQTSHDYFNALAPDSAGRNHSSVVTSVKLDATRYVDTQQYFDGRGALTQNFSSYTSTNGWSITDIEYDAMGRAFRRSNPYYSTSNYGTCLINPSDIWTTATFDVAGRVTQVTSPRGDDASPTAIATIQISYAGEVVTFTDQAGKQRRQITDALGRLVRLDEPTTSGLGSVSAPNQKTEYTYDVLDNLVKVLQGSQERYFKYDSLSRRIRDKLPEQTPNSAYNLSDSVNTSGTWTRKFEYNSHGLITRVSDARGITADYSYDALNRLTLIDHSDSTPDVRYFYDSQTLPSGAPSYDHGYANGRMIAITYGASSSIDGSYFGYDSMGNVKEQRQVTGGNTYSLSYTYNLGGLLANQTYPSGRVLTHSYDNAGRLSQISDGTTTFTSGLTYAPSGGMLSETWGNGAVRSAAYNSALQISQVKLRQSSSGSELQRYDYLYGEVTQSNGSVDKSKNTGQVGRIDGIIDGSGTKEWDQRFSYDELGRISIGSEYQNGTGGTPSWKQEFTYDRYGNRFQSGAANTGVGFTPVVSSDITAASNRFITSGSTPVTYDAAGNITQDAKFRFMNYTYDANGLQLTASAMNSDLSQSSVYDGLGQRVQTTSMGLTRRMVYDIFGQLVADYNGTTMDKENIYRGGQLLAVYEAASTCYMTISDFVTYFFNGALHRNPTSNELSEWTLKLSKAQAQSNAILIKVAQDLGTHVFTSGEYTNTIYHNYIVDLYMAYLQRAYDPSGYSNWMNALQGGASFATVRNGFAYSLEFQNNVVRLCGGTSSGTSTSANLKYVLTDAQGSARALMNNSGSGTSTIVSRHDYLPFGEEIFAGVGARSTSQKYSVTDRSRQKFALTERDEATGLDQTWFRKYDSFAGRWTSPDPLGGNPRDPQQFNAYNYSGNDPVNRVDPLGLLPCVPGETGAQCGWSSVSAGFWGWGDLNNRRRSRDWALEDKPPALWCPPDRICFMESLDDKRFRLVIFEPSDFQKWDPGPTKKNWERAMRNWRAQKLPECLRDAENDYKAANDKLMNEASSWGTDMTAIRALSILGSMHWDVQKLSGRLALRAAIHAAVKSQVVYLAAAGAAAFGDLFGRMVAHGQARARAIANCNALYGPRASDPKD